MSKNPSASVVEATTASFAKDAIERSQGSLVVVDFWAQWCAPCRALGPMLEKLAAEYGGRFTLVKVETDACPEIAAEFGVRSIPAVFALRDQAVVDSFVGALPESAIRKWLDRLLPTESDRLIADAVALEASDPGGAEMKYRAALALKANDANVSIGLARVLLALGRIDEARALIATLESRGFLEPAAEKVKAELALRSGGEATSLDALRAEADAAPGDHGRQWALAQALAASGAYAEALDRCLNLVENDRAGTGEPARKLMVNIFATLPDDSELAGEYRRKLSAALY
jgi:putative thioredoxin